MGMLNSIREGFAALASKIAGDAIIARIVPTWQAARPLPTPEDLRRLANEGYRRHALIFACMQELMTSASEPILKVGRRRRDGEIDEDAGHPLNAVLLKPNGAQSQLEFLEQFIMFYLVAGNTYVHKVRNKHGATVQMWTLRPDRTKVKVDTRGQVEFYEFSIDGMLKQFPPAADVIHMRAPDPLDDFYGLSPIQVLARWGDLDTQTADYLRAYFLNAGAPSGLLKFKTQVPKAERERVQELWRLRHSGEQGWHNVSVIDADVDYESLGGAPERLRLNFIFDQTETRICMVFGVPPIVVGAAIGLMRSTFANYKEARASMWEETLAPLYRRIGEALTRGFADEYGPDLVIYFDLDTVKALQEDLDKKRAFALDAWNADLITRNEAREMVGLEADPLEGDGYKATLAPSFPALDPFAQSGGGNGNDPMKAGREGNARAALPAWRHPVTWDRRIDELALEVRGLRSDLEDLEAEEAATSR